jgi:type IV pilus assembly protein PilO
VKITSLSREPEVTHDFYAEVPFRIAIEGNYHDLARFFERVGRLPRIVNVGALRVSVATEDRLGTQLRVEGTATTFRFLNEVPRAASATPRVSLRGKA